MPKRILVDAVHPQDTKVVILENGRVQEFDSETTIKKQVKGNIYLAKITRVEPSLQAAFVDYGGQRHGFLSLSDIHPDYYQIPVADKKELMESLRREVAGRGVDEEEDYKGARGSGYDRKSRSSYDDAVELDDESGGIGDEEINYQIEADYEDSNLKDAFIKKLLGRYKIQEVIKRGQIILVQVEKEERGNKGASLTTYISLAGRYCVLMPNSHRQGGVSRRIVSYEDRRNLRNIINSLNIPDDTSVIIRTAGAGKTKEQIKTDYEYLINLWNNIRELTLSSNAPKLIHSEGDVIKRMIRDMFYDDVDEILIEGKEAFDRAKGFVKKVMGGQSAKVKLYDNRVPIFSRYKVDEQVEELYSNIVYLESGGYLVFNPTEALISIDVNSGKSTSQRDVEETAIATNMEAASEVARQLRLRDLSGLIVIDFIDMLELRNRKAVERALRAAFAGDRAKIQMGRISLFGLLEMSRQRMGPSFYEVNMVQCPSCKGIGYVKAAETLAVQVLRKIEANVCRMSCTAADVYVAPEVALYVLNYKRDEIGRIETKTGIKIYVHSDPAVKSDDCVFEKSNMSSFVAEGKAENEQIDEIAANSNEKHDRKLSFKKGGGKTSGKGKHDNGVKKRGAAGVIKGLWAKVID